MEATSRKVAMPVCLPGSVAVRLLPPAAVLVLPPAAEGLAGGTG
jgi:hypothetical protein